MNEMKNAQVFFVNEAGPRPVTSGIPTDVTMHPHGISFTKGDILFFYPWHRVAFIRSPPFEP